MVFFFFFFWGGGGGVSFSLLVEEVENVIACLSPSLSRFFPSPTHADDLEVGARSHTGTAASSGGDERPRRRAPRRERRRLRRGWGRPNRQVVSTTDGAQSFHAGDPGGLLHLAVLASDGVFRERGAGRGGALALRVVLVLLLLLRRRRGFCLCLAAASRRELLLFVAHWNADLLLDFEGKSE